MSELYSPGISFRVSRRMFIRERVQELPTLLSEPALKLVFGFESGLALGILLADKVNVPVLGALFAGVAGGTLPVISYPFYHVITNPPLTQAYPRLRRRLIDRYNLQSLIIDGVRACIPSYGEGGETRILPYSLVNYKKRLVTEYGKRIKTTEQAEVLMDLMLGTPDPELKLFIIKNIERYGKPHLQTYVKNRLNQPGETLTELDNAVCHYLLSRRNPPNNKKAKNEQQLFSYLETRSIYQLATSTSQQIIDVLNKQAPIEPTLFPFIKLFTLRRIKEEIGRNKILTSKNSQLVAQLTDELLIQLRRFQRALRESKYDPNSPTIGLEIQPDTDLRNEKSLLYANKKDIQQIIKYGGLGSQKDYPFEIVLPPSRTPITQLLMLREILMLTGIPIKFAGIQINFGGFGRIHTIPIALQRIILAVSKLRPVEKIFRERGACWDASSRINPATKGEISTRHPNNPLTKNDVKKITPDDEDHPEFQNVSELRAGVGADSFYSFAKGLIAAHQLAGLAKAGERSRLGIPLTDLEREMSIKWTDICQGCNEVFDRYGLPNINNNWSKDYWKTFAAFTGRGGEITKQIKRLLKTLL